MEEIEEESVKTSKKCGMSEYGDEERNTSWRRLDRSNSGREGGEIDFGRGSLSGRCVDELRARDYL